MTRDNIVFTTCGFLLGLVIGGLLIGPRMAKYLKKDDAPVAEAAQTAAQAPAAVTQPAMGVGVGAPGTAQTMDMVRKQLADLKATVEREPNNADALVQLGNMYMDAAKYPQAVEYYERALVVRDDPAVRTDLGICYKQAGQLEKSVEAFRKAAADSPNQWQAMFNEAIVLGEMKRYDEARSVAAKLAQLRPSDPQVQKLNQALAGKS
jgi:tetratricopeptide (TPR) repeat protein